MVDRRDAVAARALEDERVMGGPSQQGQVATLIAAAAQHSRLPRNPKARSATFALAVVEAQ